MPNDDRQWLARLEALVEERLAEYRRTNVFVFDMFIDADDDSTDGPPNLWIARDHYTGELIQRLTGAELEGFSPSTRTGSNTPDWSTNCRTNSSTSRS